MHIKRERRCVACRASKLQDKMLRVVRIDGEYVIDRIQKLDGRGAYVCKNADCLALAIKKRLFNRAFKANIPEDLYNQLKSEQI